MDELNHPTPVSKWLNLIQAVQAKHIPTGSELVMSMKHGAWMYSHSTQCSIYDILCKEKYGKIFITVK